MSNIDVSYTLSDLERNVLRNCATYNPDGLDVDGVRAGTNYRASLPQIRRALWSLTFRGFLEAKPLRKKKSGRPKLLYFITKLGLAKYEYECIKSTVRNHDEPF